MDHPLSIEYIKTLVEYDHYSGIFTWRERTLRIGIERLDKAWNTRFAGKVVLAGTEPKGHKYFSLHDKKYKAHRIAWAVTYNEWPASDIDHINGDPADNRIDNLRLATQSENNYNSRLRRDNTSGIKGISWNKTYQKWEVYINVDGRRIRLGKFEALDKAIAIRRAAELKYHGQFARAA